MHNKNQKKTYATKKGKQTFEGLVVGETLVKMKKPGKKKALISNWEGPYWFVTHAMDLEILILKKVAKYASLKMLMEISGKDLARIYKSIMFYRIEKAKGPSFLRKGRVTYVIG
jgi:hypothetical protein